MSRDYSTYESPFCTRYASKEMQYIFSADKKFSTWRRLWVALARAEMNLGIDKITQEMVDELESHITDINYEVAEEREKLVRHDVMSHVYAYGKQCPKAAGIIHLGATSCYVGDNTDVIIMRDALQLVKKKLVNVINNLAKFADEHKSQPCLAYTHLQPAQLTTVGKRASLWINELLMDYEEVEYRISTLKLLGQKGTTGTQASFVELFGGDSAKIKALEKSIANEMGFDACVPVSGQTYSRKMDSMVLATLGGIAQSCSKFSNDLRILANFKEMEEPFEKTLNPAFTAGTQWFERTLDDSANKRISVAEAFLGIDAILNIMINITDGLVVYPKVIEQRVMRELPFMATENIMMRAVEKGGNRQELHEALRGHSMAAADVVKKEGGENDLVKRIAADPIFQITEEEIRSVLKPENYTGRAPEQVEEFLRGFVRPVLEKNKELLGEHVELSV